MHSKDYAGNGNTISQHFTLWQNYFSFQFIIQLLTLPYGIKIMGNLDNDLITNVEAKGPGF